VPGKITLVDFYADWCAPCRVISPQLERMVKSDRELVLRKIDIVNWDSPVVKQFNIRSIPQIRVFDQTGNMVGPPTFSLNQVQEYIDQAKQE